MTTKTTNTLMFLILCILFPNLNADTKLKLDPEAAAALQFERRDDGKCHILSEGGKLMVMHNKHADKTISFRLIRYFAGVRQQGRVTGTTTPGEGEIKLGCTLVDGREQTWKIERAKFVVPPSPQNSN